MKELTVLMPCLNEEQTLPICIGEIKGFIERYGIDAEILVADNGSSDRSVSIAESLGARVAHIKEKGYGSALRGGIAAAEGKYIIMGDADGSYDFPHMDNIVEGLREGYPLVMGNRFKGGIEKGAMPFLHRLGVPALSLIASIRFGTKWLDYHCGLRGFDREYALKLGFKCTGMEFATEMIALFSLSGAEIKEVPTTLRPDKRDRKPHLKTFRDGMRHLKFIFGYKCK